VFHFENKEISDQICKRFASQNLKHVNFVSYQDTNKMRMGWCHNAFTAKLHP